MESTGPIFMIRKQYEISLALGAHWHGNFPPGAPDGLKMVHRAHIFSGIS